VEIDISRFKAAFFEEAAENAAIIESSLLELERTSGDTEILHRIFRAAHSIKGGSGTFGLDALAHFTHGMENVLDKLREGAISMTPALVGLLFRACDALKRLLQAARDGEAGDAGTEALRAELLREASPPASAGGEDAEGDAPAQAAKPAASAPKSLRRTYRIRFVPDPMLFERGLDPVLLLRDLASLGDLTRRDLELGALPSLDELNPERCYLGWQLELSSSFVSDPEQADAVLRGAVVSFGSYPTVADPASGRATGVQVAVVLQFSLTERATGRVLVVDECRHSGNLSEQIAALLLDAGYRLPFARITGADSFIPLGEAARFVLPSEDEIITRARALVAGV